MKTLSEMIESARRELVMRTKVYPRWIANGKMTNDQAVHEIHCMASIHATLIALQEFLAHPLGNPPGWAGTEQPQQQELKGITEDA